MEEWRSHFWEMSLSMSDENRMDWKPPGYTFVSSEKALKPAVRSIEAAKSLGIDLETTGLNPRTSRARILSIATEDACWVLDLFALPPDAIMQALAGKRLVGHNLLFDLGFLARLGVDASVVSDTMLMDRLIHSGEFEIRHSLAEVARRELGLTLSKEMQLSDWTGALTIRQLDYAAADATVLLPLETSLRRNVQKEGRERAADIENRCLPAVVWMSKVGVPIDGPRWRDLADEVASEADRIRAEMDSIAPRPHTLDLGFGWNWDNPGEVREALRLSGCDIANTNDETLSGLDHPLARILRQYREKRKLTTTYGVDWLKHLDGNRVYPDWRQFGAASGRMTCSSPNLQQIPRDPRYRRCIAAPAGRVLVKADYSQIELRIAARIANETRMIEAYEAGQDLHRLTAQRVMNREEITRSDRQLAKAINFGLLYGMGAEGFRRYARAQFAIELSSEEAAAYRNAFFESYPGLRSWHQAMKRSRDRESRTLTGRRHLLTDRSPLPMRLNLPVQGTGADGIKRALALLWERRGQCPGAFPVLACHDEIVIECDENAGNSAAEWLRSAMVDGMAPLIRPAPVEVDLQIGRTWAG